MARRGQVSREKRNKKIISRLIILLALVVIWGLSYLYISHTTSKGLTSLDITEHSRNSE